MLAAALGEAWELGAGSWNSWEQPGGVLVAGAWLLVDGWADGVCRIGLANAMAGLLVCARGKTTDAGSMSYGLRDMKFEGPRPEPERQRKQLTRVVGKGKSASVCGMCMYNVCECGRSK